MIPYEMYCLICGEKFSAQRAHARTCSDKCRNILHRIKKSEKKYHTNSIPQWQFIALFKKCEKENLLDDYNTRLMLIKVASGNTGLLQLIFRNADRKYILLLKRFNDGQLLPEYFVYGNYPATSPFVPDLLSTGVIEKMEDRNKNFSKISSLANFSKTLDLVKKYNKIP